MSKSSGLGPPGLLLDQLAQMKKRHSDSWGKVEGFGVWEGTYKSDAGSMQTAWIAQRLCHHANMKQVWKSLRSKSELSSSDAPRLTGPWKRLSIGGLDPVEERLFDLALHIDVWRRVRQQFPWFFLPVGERKKRLERVVSAVRRLEHALMAVPSIEAASDYLPAEFFEHAAELAFWAVTDLRADERAQSVPRIRFEDDPPSVWLLAREEEILVRTASRLHKNLGTNISIDGHSSGPSNPLLHGSLAKLRAFYENVDTETGETTRPDGSNAEAIDFCRRVVGYFRAVYGRPLHQNVTHIYNALFENSVGLEEVKRWTREG